MKVEVVYVACDGTKFSSPAKCKEYENHIVSLINEFNRHVLLLTATKRPIICPTGIGIEDAMTWFHMAYSNCVYVNINTELSNDLIAFIDENLGLIFPPNKVGLYKYDYDTDEWVSAD